MLFQSPIGLFNYLKTTFDLHDMKNYMYLQNYFNRKTVNNYSYFERNKQKIFLLDSIPDSNKLENIKKMAHPYLFQQTSRRCNHLH